MFYLIVSDCSSSVADLLTKSLAEVLGISFGTYKYIASYKVATLLLFEPSNALFHTGLGD